MGPEDSSSFRIRGQIRARALRVKAVAGTVEGVRQGSMITLAAVVSGVVPEYVARNHRSVLQLRRILGIGLVDSGLAGYVRF